MSLQLNSVVELWRVTPIVLDSGTCMVSRELKERDRSAICCHDRIYSVILGFRKAPMKLFVPPRTVFGGGYLA